MKWLVATAALALCPLQAIANEAQAACIDFWEDILVFAGDFGGEIAAATVESETDGWCAVSATLDVNDIEARFRVDQFAQAPENTRSLEVTFEDISAPIGVFDVAAALSYQPDAGALRLHQLTARADDGRGVRARANIVLEGHEGGMDFQAAVPALVVHDASVSIFVTSGLLQEAGVDLSDLTRVAVDDALIAVGVDQIDRRSRNEFLRFAGAVPNAQGTLDVNLDMPDGKNVLQVVGALGGNAALNDMLAAVLTDATVDLLWKPGRM